MDDILLVQMSCLAEPNQIIRRRIGFQVLKTVNFFLFVLGKNLFKHIGCYQDGKNRFLKGYIIELKEKIQNSPHTCFNICLQKSFKYAGVEGK